MAVGGKKRSPIVRSVHEVLSAGSVRYLVAPFSLPLVESVPGIFGSKGMAILHGGTFFGCHGAMSQKDKRSTFTIRPEY